MADRIATGYMPLLKLKARLNDLRLHCPNSANTLRETLNPQPALKSGFFYVYKKRIFKALTGFTLPTLFLSAKKRLKRGLNRLLGAFPASICEWLYQGLPVRPFF
jgi:hypothetical protein